MTPAKKGAAEAPVRAPKKATAAKAKATATKANTRAAKDLPAMDPRAVSHTVPPQVDDALGAIWHAFKADADADARERLILQLDAPALVGLARQAGDAEPDGRCNQMAGEILDRARVVLCRRVENCSVEECTISPTAVRESQQKSPVLARGLSQQTNFRYGVGITTETAFEYPLSVPLVSTDVAT